MEEKIELKKPKYLYLELLRIVSIFFVIFNHTQDNGYFLFSRYSSNDIAYWFYLMISIFCKFSVPVFFGISGALMLGKNYDNIGNLWKSKILRMFIVLISASFIYYLDYINIKDLKFDMNYFVQYLYNSNIRTHLWYLYAYIAFLISLPFIHYLVNNINKKMYYYMFALGVIFIGIVPSFEYILWKGQYVLNSDIVPGWIISKIIIFPCAGYFVHTVLETKGRKKNLVMLWTINIISIVFTAFMTYYMSKNSGLNRVEGFHSRFVLINCITIFFTFKYFFADKKFNERVEKIIISLGSATFGVYLVHIIVFNLNFVKEALDKLLHLGINPMISVFIQCILVMFVSYLVALIIKKIPIINKLV